MLSLKKEFLIVFKKIKSGGGEKGVSLYFSIIFLSILLAMALGLGTILIGQTRMIREMGDSVAAFYAADTGIERILYEDKLCREPGCAALPWPCDYLGPICDKGRSDSDSPLSGNVGPATYEVNFNAGATNIISKGMYLGTRRAIEVTR